MTSVLIDGYALSGGSERRGIGTYLKRIIAGLAERPDLSVTVLAERDVPLPPAANRVVCRSHAPRRFRDFEHDLVLPAKLSRRGCDVFHSPAQHPPRRSSIPWIQTLHDLTPLIWPHPLLAGERRRWEHVGPRLRRASAVAAVSSFSADQGIRHLGLDPRAITVIPQGIDRAAFHPGEPAAGEAPYLLHVAAWGPHKGFGEALEVISRLAERGLPHRLMLAGPQDEWMLRQVRAAVAASRRPDRVEVAGYVDDLAGTYRGADALLMTSRCEGFGFPVLEAMACGTPVVAFANSSLPEVVGDAGMLIADGDLDAMASAVQRVLGDADVRGELVERGLERAARFRWEDTIEAYALLLRSVAR